MCVTLGVDDDDALDMFAADIDKSEKKTDTKTVTFETGSNTSDKTKSGKSPFLVWT